MLICVSLVSLLALAVVAAAEVVPLWGRWERGFTAGASASPETEFTVAMTAPSGQIRTVDGYWDGDRTWRARFMPDEEGEWHYRASATPSAAGLEGVAGAFTCRRAAGRARFLEHGAVRVAESGTYLAHADGTPFFWLGDTVWTGPQLSAREDWQTYLEDRAAKQFSVVQFNALAPWRAAPTDAEGQVAFTGRDPIRINPQYFRRLDERMDAINAAGFLAAPVLVWSLTAKDPGHYLCEDDCIRLARYQVARYGAHHVAWILAGDNPYAGEGAERWKRIGRAVFGRRPHAPVATHPTGTNWPWEAFRDEEWLDLLGYQSGHGDDANTLRWIHSGPPSEHWRKPPPRPLINLEPPYEDHRAYHSGEPHSAYNVRRAAYWSLLNAPTAGLTYGGHGLWSWQTAVGETPADHPKTGVARTWREALSLPGSTHMKHLAELFASQPWWTLRPAPELLAAQPGEGDPARYVSAARSERGDLALFYLPVGGELRLKAGALPGKPSAEWFDPRTGQRRAGASTSPGVYRAPDMQDWLLALRRG